MKLKPESPGVGVSVGQTGLLDSVTMCVSKFCTTDTLGGWSRQERGDDSRWHSWLHLKRAIWTVEWTPLTFNFSQVHLLFPYNPPDLHRLLSTFNPHVSNIPTVGTMVKTMHKMELLSCDLCTEGLQLRSTSPLPVTVLKFLILLKRGLANYVAGPDCPEGERQRNKV